MTAETWRVGRKLLRTLYVDDQVVGMVDTPDLAARIAAAMNDPASPLALRGTLASERESHNRTMADLRVAEGQVSDLSAELADHRATLERVLREREVEAEKTDGWYVALGAAQRQVAAVRALCDQAEAEPTRVYFRASGHCPADLCAVLTGPLRRALDGAAPTVERCGPECSEMHTFTAARVQRGNPWLLAHDYVEPQHVGALCEHVTHVTADGLGTSRCNEPRDTHQTPAAGVAGLSTAPTHPCDDHCAKRNAGLNRSRCMDTCELDDDPGGRELHRRLTAPTAHDVIRDVVGVTTAATVLARLTSYGFAVVRMEDHDG